MTRIRRSQSGISCQISSVALAHDLTHVRRFRPNRVASALRDHDVGSMRPEQVVPAWLAGVYLVLVAQESWCQGNNLRSWMELVFVLAEQFVDQVDNLFGAIICKTVVDCLATSARRDEPFETEPRQLLGYGGLTG